MKKYELTEAHKKKLKPWADRWIANAMSTKAMDEKEKSLVRKHVKGLYRAANLEPPPDERIVFVPSPFVLRFAGGFAAAIWYLRKTGKLPREDATWDATWDATRDATWDATGAATGAATGDATGDATRDATRDATGAATRDATGAATEAATRDATVDATGAATRAATEAATRAATGAATRDATWDATRDATRAATEAATWAATEAATEAATRDATGDATRAATRAATGDATETKKTWWRFSISLMVNISDMFGLGKFGLSCAYSSSNMWNGGNQWSDYPAFLSFFRHVSKLKLDYSKWDHYEKLAEHSGHRIMHEKFCMISDRPKTLKVNARNQPHCEDGPFCEWRDGSALFALNGIRVPQWVIETPKDGFTKDMIIGEKNADVRREIIRKIGPERLLKILDYKVIDSFDGYELITFDMGDGRVRPHLKMVNPSIGCVHVEGVRPEIKTVKEAICFRNGLKEYEAPMALS